MKIAIDVELTNDRITARLRDGKILFDETGLIAVDRTHNPPLVLGWASEAENTGQSVSVEPVVSRGHLVVAAQTAEAAAVVTWAKLRPGWRQILAPMDALEVWITVEGWEDLTADDRREFSGALGYHPQITWWVCGRRVKF